MRIRTAAITSLVALAFALTATIGAAPARADQASVGSRAAEFDKAAKTGKGKTFKLRAMRGKWVAVTFGGSWCKPCRKELPAWDKLAKQVKGKITFVAVNLDNDPADGKKFMAGLKIRNLLVVYSPEDKTDTASHYDPDTFPSTFIVDPKGIIRYVHSGYVSGDADKLRAEIDKLTK
ncbi:MAG: TlpA family protein disulfide reductase [Kofleriaceae bacterium]|nr:TlpA family protein disulfide reductase [Myxococcales bacterium]MCB9560912.1 TlpA family protein disulfide reductase [Kofleriaceae bacterium]